MQQDPAYPLNHRRVINAGTIEREVITTAKKIVLHPSRADHAQIVHADIRPRKQHTFRTACRARIFRPIMTLSTRILLPCTESEFTRVNNSARLTRPTRRSLCIAATNSAHCRLVYSGGSPRTAALARASTSSRMTADWRRTASCRTLPAVWLLTAHYFRSAATFGHRRQSNALSAQRYGQAAARLPLPCPTISPHSHGPAVTGSSVRTPPERTDAPVPTNRCLITRSAPKSVREIR